MYVKGVDNDDDKRKRTFRYVRIISRPSYNDQENNVKEKDVKKKKNLQICADPLSSALRILRELTAATVDDCLGGEKGGEGGGFGARYYLDIYM